MNPKKYHTIVGEIISLLEKQAIWFEKFEHEPVRTSEEAAQIRTGYNLSQGAKALILRIKKTGKKDYFAQFVIPGNKRLNSRAVTEHLDAKSIRFATAEELATITSGIEAGGIPPFGNLFNIPVYFDIALLNQEKIIFNAGDRSFSIGMKARDYLKIANPIIANFISQA